MHPTLRLLIAFASIFVLVLGENTGIPKIRRRPILQPPTTTASTTVHPQPMLPVEPPFIVWQNVSEMIQQPAIGESILEIEFFEVSANEMGPNSPMTAETIVIEPLTVIGKSATATGFIVSLVCIGTILASFAVWKCCDQSQKERETEMIEMETV